MCPVFAKEGMVTAMEISKLTELSWVEGELIFNTGKVT